MVLVIIYLNALFHTQFFDLNHHNYNLCILLYQTFIYSIYLIYSYNILNFILFFFSRELIHTLFVFIFAGKPLPDVSWYKGDERLAFTRQGSVCQLHIPSLSREMAGTRLQCRVEPPLLQPQYRDVTIKLFCKYYTMFRRPWIFMFE